MKQTSPRKADVREKKAETANDDGSKAPSSAKKSTSGTPQKQKQQQKNDEPIVIRRSQTLPTSHLNATGTTKQSKKKGPSNELTKLIPGYTAERTLHASALDKHRLGMDALTQKAQATDPSTKHFLVHSGKQQTHMAAMTKTKGARNSGNGLPSTYLSAYASFKQGTKRIPDETAGAGWFHMQPASQADDETLKTDLAIIRNRTYLDPKRFYKSADMSSKYVQRGTVIEGSGEYYSARMAKKQRRANLAEEMLADDTATGYAKRKFKKMQQEQDAAALRRKQSNRRRKGGKRGFA